MEKQLITYSRQLRSNQTNAEKLLWQKLRKRQLGVRFQRQYVFDNKYIVDFYCASLKLIIEINGGQHNDNHQDDIRDNYIKKRGCKILRFWNNDILENIEGCLSQITNLIPTVPPLNIKGRLEENYASRELHEDASTERHPQKTNAFSTMILVRLMLVAPRSAEPQRTQTYVRTRAPEDACRRPIKSLSPCLFTFTGPTA